MNATTSRETPIGGCVQRLVRRQIVAFWNNNDGTVLVSLSCGHEQKEPCRRKRTSFGGFPNTLVCKICSKHNDKLSCGGDKH